jgi:hypothetical protein
VTTPIIGQNPEPAAPAETQAPQPGAGDAAAAAAAPQAPEHGGRGGLDPVRYGDWEKNGRCIDF